MQEKLNFNKELKRLLLKDIATIEKQSLKVENNGYLLLKQNFLYQELYELDKEIFREVSKLENMDKDHELSIKKINDQQALLLLELSNKHDIKLKKNDILQESLTRASVSYFISAKKKV